MPSVASLQVTEYYAHPRNAFWSLMQALFEVDRAWSYDNRAAALVRRGIAVWDVLESCERPGSLDAAIDPSSMQPNDLAGLLKTYPSIRTLFFNGQMAATVFRRHQLPVLGDIIAEIACHRLPSTSPANASWSFERKLAAWEQVREALSL